AKVNEQRAAVVAARIDPAAKRDFFTDIRRAKLTTSMRAKQGKTPNVKRIVNGVCARRESCRRAKGHCIRRGKVGKVRLDGPGTEGTEGTGDNGGNGGDGGGRPGTNRTSCRRGRSLALVRYQGGPW